ncbi:MAG: BatA domain-containing protein [Singulisphaera sp.]
MTPLYILGALSVAAPLLFHLIRRTTRGEVPFSSLIFLSPSPPRLTRRSRLDNWFLLLLRGLALTLLALAFARPFLRQAAGLSLGEGERRRVAILVDTSASMRRGDLWARAKAKAIEAIASCRPEDLLAVFAFDAATRPVLGFDEAATLDPSRRQAVARALVDRLSPGWGETHLGQALIDAAGAIEDVGDAARKSSGSRVKRRIVLIGDLQQGSHLDVLGHFEWPSDVELDPGRSSPKAPTPASGGSPGRTRTNLPPEERTSSAWGHQRPSLEAGGVRPGLGRRQGRADLRVRPPGETRVVRAPPLGVSPRDSSGSRETRRSSITPCTSPPNPRRSPRSSTSAPTPPTIPPACSTTSAACSRRLPGGA